MSIRARRSLLLAPAFSFSLAAAAVAVASALAAGCAQNVDDTSEPNADVDSGATGAVVDAATDTTTRPDTGARDAQATDAGADTGSFGDARADGTTSSDAAVDTGTDASSTADASDGSTAQDAATTADASDGATPMIDAGPCTVTPLACDGRDHACTGVVNQGCPGSVALGAPTTASPLAGNASGGTAYDDACPAGQVLTGLAGRFGASIDAIGGVCGIPTIKEDTSTTPYTYSVTIAPGAALTIHGGSTSAWARQCPADMAIVAIGGRAGNLIDGVTIECAPLVVAGTIGSFSVAPGTIAVQPYLGGTGGSPFARFACPAPQVARMANIRAGNSVDAFGITCGTTALTLR